MGPVLAAFGAGFSIVFLVQTATGYVADRSYKVVAIQPLIALSWVLGTTAVVKGAAPAAAYIVGSTAGAGLAMFFRRRGDK